MTRINEGFFRREALWTVGSGRSNGWDHFEVSYSEVLRPYK